MNALTRRAYLGASAGALALVGGCVGRGSDRRAWTATDGPASGIAVVDGTAYVGTLGDVYAIDVETGSITWTYGEANDEINQPPTVHDGSVYVGVNSGEGVHAIDSGSRQWHFDDLVNHASSPVVTEDTVYVTAGGYLYALDRETGTERRSLELADSRPTTPALAEDALFLVTDDELWAVDRESFERRWTDPVYSNDAAADGERVYVSPVGEDGLTALDPADGSVLWSADTDATSKPVVTDDRVYASSQTDGGIVAYSRDGERQWESELGRTVSVPDPSEDAVYTVDVENRELFAAAADDGSTEWSVELDDSPRYRPTSAGEHVLVPTTGGVVAFET